jgi:hypothetical protein
MKRILQYTAITVGGLSVAYVAFMFWFSFYVASSSRDNWEKMQNTPFSCPPGMVVRHDGWSENGTMRYCQPPEEGPWEAWMGGYRRVAGYYKNGKEEGTWRWFDKDGNVTKTVEYKEGKEIAGREK